VPAPRYRPRACYRTRRSAAERVAVDPKRDFGLTALDRPRLDDATLPLRPRRAAPAHWLDRPRAIRRVALAVLLGCALTGAAVGALLAIA
jgi:hypothetical protein